MIHSLPAGPLLEHELLRGVDGPVVPLARPAKRLGQLDEALVEAEVVAHRVLPSLKVEEIQFQCQIRIPIPILLHE